MLDRSPVALLVRVVRLFSFSPSSIEKHTNSCTYVVACTYILVAHMEKSAHSQTLTQSRRRSRGQDNGCKVFVCPCERLFFDPPMLCWCVFAPRLLCVAGEVDIAVPGLGDSITEATVMQYLKRE